MRAVSGSRHLLNLKNDRGKENINKVNPALAAAVRMLAAISIIS